MEAEIDISAQLCVVEPMELSCQKTQATARYSKATDSVPDSNEPDSRAGIVLAWWGVSVLGSKLLGLAGVGTVIPLLIEPVCLIYEFGVLLSQDSTLPNQASGASDREGSPTRPQSESRSLGQRPLVS